MTVRPELQGARSFSLATPSDVHLIPKGAVVTERIVTEEELLRDGRLVRRNGGEAPLFCGQTALKPMSVTTTRALRSVSAPSTAVPPSGAADNHPELRVSTLQHSLTQVAPIARHMYAGTMTASAVQQRTLPAASNTVKTLPVVSVSTSGIPPYCGPSAPTAPASVSAEVATSQQQAPLLAPATAPSPAQAPAQAPVAPVAAPAFVAPDPHAGEAVNTEEWDDLDVTLPPADSMPQVCIESHSEQTPSVPMMVPVATDPPTHGTAHTVPIPAATTGFGVVEVAQDVNVQAVEAECTSDVPVKDAGVEKDLVAKQENQNEPVKAKKGAAARLSRAGFAVA